MSAWEIRQLHQIFFSLLDHNSLEINFIDLGSALSRSLCCLRLVIMDEMLVADGLKHSEAFYQFVQTFLSVDYCLFMTRLAMFYRLFCDITAQN